MLTILLRNKKSGREELYQAHNVVFLPGVREEKDGDVMVVKPDDAGLFINQNMEGESCHIGLSLYNDDLRDVFVMNDTGQTIARYLL